MINVTNENYYAPELNKYYMGASQFKSFLKCEAQTIYGLDHPTEPTKPMLIGSYLDSMVEGTQSEFETRYADVIYKKRGSGLYAEFERVHDLYKRMA